MAIRSQVAQAIAALHFKYGMTTYPGFKARREKFEGKYSYSLMPSPKKRNLKKDYALPI